MRRKDREITETAKILEILDTCAVCRIGIYDGEETEPYIIPMNFAYSMENRNLTLYFHSALKGRKLDLLKKDPHVCFEMDCNHMLLPHELPCEYSFRYSCLMGTGTASFIEEPAEKAAVLSLLMEKQSGKTCRITEKEASSVAVFKVTAEKYSCKALK